MSGDGQLVAKGRGRKFSLLPGDVEEIQRPTHQELPAAGSTQWSTRSLAARVGVGEDTVAQIWADYNLMPWKVDTFKVSNDLRFEEKVVDVVGPYWKPPARARVSVGAGAATSTASDDHCWIAAGVASFVV